MANHLVGEEDNKSAIRRLVEDWAQAVRERNLEKILAHHSNDIVMYDVPPPFQSLGIEAYKKTWNIFFAYTKPGVFDIQELNIITGDTVAFCYSTMKCADKSNSDDYIELSFRLTIGLKKIGDQWTILHEHHSVPGE
jgi:ketosteroid isomerase-like protein